MAVSRADRFPLSAAQLWVWWDLKLHPDDISYGSWDYFDVRGAMPFELYGRAMRHVVEHSLALRMQLHEDGHGPRQSVREDAGFDIPFIDVSRAADPDAAAWQWMRADHARPFELTAWPLFRFAFLKLADDHFIVYRNFHHLAVDGFGIGVFGARVGYVYHALRNGEPLPELGTRDDYGAYVAAESVYNNSLAWIEDRDFWRRSFETLPEPVTLARSLTTGTAERRSRVLQRQLEPTLQRRLEAVASDLGVDFGRMLIGMVALYLHRTTGARQIPMSMPVHGRDRSMIELVGMCINMVPLHFTVDPGATLAEFLRAAESHIDEVLIHRRYRFEDLRRDFGLHAADPGPFRVTANIIRAADHGPQRYPITLHSVVNGPVEDLGFVLIPNRANPNYFRFNLLFNPALYAEWEASAHQSRYIELLDSLARDPGQRIEALRWQGSDTPRHAECFPALFSACATATPHLTALVSGPDSIDYGALEVRSNQLAHHLRELRVGSDSIVALFLPRSIDAIVGILAIWKSGGAYLPINPADPDARISAMLADARVSVAITRSDVRTGALACIGSVVELDRDRERIEARPPLPPEVAVRPSDLAYVMYTSGSSGTPKGVLVEHRGLVNLAREQARHFGITTETRVLQYAPLTFDISVGEIVTALLCRGVLHIVRDVHDKPGKALVDNRIEVAMLPPSILARIEPQDVPTLRTLILCGEACPASVARRWRAHCNVVNAYGPTEATVTATLHRYEGADALPLGYPLANVEIYVLSEDHEERPIGVTGEIHIAGRGVARGYLNRPELTEQKFLRDPFATTPDARMYRTGDLGRRLPDGTIEYLGRSDAQVKVRGHRIELPEIEATLLQHPAITAAVVLVRSDLAQSLLAAYVVARQPVTSAELRRHCITTLPRYMAALAVHFLEAIPLNANGKVDRKALLAVTSAIDPRRPHLAPRTEREATLAQFWSEVLGIELPSMDDQFFDLGGTSIHMIELVLCIENRYGVQLDLSSLYEHTTIATLAAALDRALSLQLEQDLA